MSFSAKKIIISSLQTRRSTLKNLFVEQTLLEDNVIVDETMSDTFWVDYLSPEELELKLLSLPKHESFQESKFEQHDNDIADFREPLSTVPEVTPPRRTKMRSKRIKRGDSLEREIAKLILSESERTHQSNLEVHPVGGLSPREILSDLLSSQNNISNSSDESDAVNSNEIIESKDSQAACIDDSTTAGQFDADNFSVLRPRELYAKASCEFDAFDFNTNSNEWAEFDIQPIFGVGCKPTRELDDDGFPVPPNKESHDEKSSTESSIVKLNADSETVEASVGVVKEKEVRTKTEEIPEDTRSACVKSCDEKSIQSEPETALPILSEGFKVNFRKFESELSPSSASKFCNSPQQTGHQTGQPYAFKRQTSIISKSPWSPKPPKHYKQSNIVLSQPGDTIF